MGSERMSAPVASRIAFAIAAAVGTIGGSPRPFEPRFVRCASGRSTNSQTSSGTSAIVGSLYVSSVCVSTTPDRGSSSRSSESVWPIPWMIPPSTWLRAPSGLIHDVGRVINPLGARSQVEGGIIQGIGHTLSEERLLDPATGTVLTQTLDAYKMPTIADVPEIVTELVDVPDEHLTNLGSKGLGEPPIVPTAAAIANAIRDATGADVRSLP